MGVWHLGGFHLVSMLGYLDPGAGSLVFQIIVAGILSFGFFIAKGLARIMGWFGVRRKEISPEVIETPTATSSEYEAPQRGVLQVSKASSAESNSPAGPANAASRRRAA